MSIKREIKVLNMSYNSTEKLKKIDKISESYGKATRKRAEATKQLAKLKEEYEKSGKGNTVWYNKNFCIM